MELNREQIIKALECCYSNGACDGCPNIEIVDCRRTLDSEAIALIKELAEENEELKASNEILTHSNDNWEKYYYDLACEVEDLRKENERLRKELGHPDPVGETGECGLKSTCKADTVREFAERLKRAMRDVAKYSFGGRDYSVIGEEFIDQIAKEMLEETQC